MKKLFIIITALIFLCSCKSELRKKMEFNLPKNCSENLSKVCNTFLEDCLTSFNYFSITTDNNKAEKQMESFKKNHPQNYMLRLQPEVLIENNITDSSEINVYKKFVESSMAEYFKATADKMAK